MEVIFRNHPCPGAFSSRSPDHCGIGLAVIQLFFMDADFPAKLAQPLSDVADPYDMMGAPAPITFLLAPCPQNNPLEKPIRKKACC